MTALEALERLRHCYIDPDYDLGFDVDEGLETIEKSLKELAEIDDVLNDYNLSKKDIINAIALYRHYKDNAYDINKKLKALEIIVSKGLYWDIDYQPFEKDNDYRAWDNELYCSVKLTKEEFDLIKEVIKSYGSN